MQPAVVKSPENCGPWRMTLTWATKFGCSNIENKFWVLQVVNHTALQVFYHLLQVSAIFELARAIELQKVDIVNVHLNDMLHNTVLLLDVREACQDMLAQTVPIFLRVGALDVITF